MDRLRFLPGLLALALAALIVAGCGAALRETAAGRVVDVTERDFSIKLSQRTVAPGTVVFRDVNLGPDDHELIVARVHAKRLPMRSDGLTVSEERLESSIVGALEPGQPESTRELRVKLKPGRYVLFCNMSGHFMGGMRADLIVQ
jgi:uncharacterized cupredoxin-like copper-binding protein